MPQLVRLTNCVICVYGDDHAPPHFHVRGPDSNGTVRLRDLQVDRGRILRRDLAEALEWAAANIDQIIAEWERLNEAD